MGRLIRQTHYIMLIKHLFTCNRRTSDDYYKCSSKIVLLRSFGRHCLFLTASESRGRDPWDSQLHDCTTPSSSLSGSTTAPHRRTKQQPTSPHGSSKNQKLTLAATPSLHHLNHPSPCNPFPRGSVMNGSALMEWVNSLILCGRWCYNGSQRA